MSFQGVSLVDSVRGLESFHVLASLCFVAFSFSLFSLLFLFVYWHIPCLPSIVLLPLSNIISSFIGRK